MADNTQPIVGGDVYAADDLTNVNGGAVSGVKAERIKVGYGDDGFYRDASLLFPLPVNIAGSSGAGTQVAQNLTAVGAASLAGTGSTAGSAVIDVSAAGNVSFHLLAASFVGTVTFEQSFDPNGANGTWAAVPCLPEDGLSPAMNSLAISTAVAYIRQFTQGMFGPRLFRVRVSAYTSGSLAVLASAGPGWVEPQPALAPSGNQIGIVVPRYADLAVTATAAAGTAVTLTLPAPGAGLYQYITGFRIQKYAAAALTGAAAPVVVTSTNLPGSLAWTFDTAQAIGTSLVESSVFSSSVRALAANTAVTFVAPLVTSAIWRLTAYYFTGP